MRYKRNLLRIFLLILIMLFSVSCKKTDSSDTTKETKKETKKEKTEKKKKGKSKKKKDKKETEEAKNPKKEDNDKKSSSGIPHILLKEVTEVRHYDDVENGGALYTIKSTYVQLKEDGKEFEPLIRALDEYNKEVNKNFEDTKAGAEGVIPGEIADRAAGFGAFMIKIVTDTYVMRADKSIVSLLNYKESAYSKAKTNYARSSCNFDTQTGKRLKLTDVVKDDKTFFELADAALVKDYTEINIESSPSEYAKSLKEADYSDLVWTVSPEGVTIYFDTYVLGGEFTDGPQVVTVYFDDNKDIFEPKYVYNEKDYVFPVMTDNMKLYLDVDGDGKKEPVYVDTLYDQSEETLETYETGMEVFVGEGKSKEVSGYDGSAYVVRKGGKYYMYLFIQDDVGTFYRFDLANLAQEGDDYYLFNLSSRENTWEQEGDIEKYGLVEETLTDTKSFMGESIGYVLSTLLSEKEWFVGDDGYPQTNDERGKVMTGIVLHTLQDIKCSEVDEKGEVKKTATIPDDSYVLPVYTDDESYVDVRIIDEKYVDVWEGEYEKYFSLNDDSLMDYDGPCYRIITENDADSINKKVNGIDIQELFEGMLFAG